MPDPLHIAFLGCGFITEVHSRQLRALGGAIATRYASRERARAEDYCRRFGGTAGYGDYLSAIADPQVDAVVVAVPPAYHLDLTLRALEAGKHVLVEKPAFLTLADYETVRAARDRAGRVVLVGRTITTSRWRSRCGRWWPRARLARWSSRTSRPSRTG